MGKKVDQKRKNATQTEDGPTLGNGVMRAKRNGADATQVELDEGAGELSRSPETNDRHEKKNKKKRKKKEKDASAVGNGGVDDGENGLDNQLKAMKGISDGIDGIGEFEDAWEDEFEEEEHHIQRCSSDPSSEDEEGDDLDIPGLGKVLEDHTAGSDGGDLEKLKGRSRSNSPKTFLPHLHGTQLGTDEELVADPTAYRMLHHLSLTWPALSFDVVRDDLGEERRKMPHSACIVAGTQAEAKGDVDQDEIMIMKWEGLHKSVREDEDEDEDGDEDLDDDEDEDDGVDEDPILTYKTIPHRGSVNRVKTQNLSLPLSDLPPRPPRPYFVASFSGTGQVHIFDIAPHLFALQSPHLIDPQLKLPKQPFHTINQHHGAEGFALSWGGHVSCSNSSSLRLLSGDIHSKIYLTTSHESGFSTRPTPYQSHTSSVEDLQWSPIEPTVFGSCSADRSLRIWDVRVKDHKSVLAVEKAHSSDVNVLSWNARTTYLLLSGGDEGGIRVWDLRNLNSGKTGQSVDVNQPVAEFNYHRAPITSVEWHPTEESVFVASGADDQVTLWDLSVEVDHEESLRSRGGAAADAGVPDQLLFVHLGQSQIKEVHFHPQIPGTVISTALDGLNVFKTISV